MTPPPTNSPTTTSPPASRGTVPPVTVVSATVPTTTVPTVTRHAGIRAEGADPVTTPPAPVVDLAVPIWTIEHVAAALHLSVDRAREYTYLPSFPAPRAGFTRNLWARQGVLDWFQLLPSAGRRTVNSGTAARGATRGAAPASVGRPAGRPPQARRSYRPRGAR